ncbi:MAG: hypothetical protein JWR85_3829 [Marmoricola sp.]|nr:hypothetical protein [Marmoricola sp.]
MLQQLDAFLALCTEYEARQKSSGYTYPPAAEALVRQSQVDMPTVRRILTALDPTLLENLVGLEYGDTNIESRVRSALGILRDRDLWALNLAPDAPSIVASALHPTIWNAAANIWGTGEYTTAVGQAAVSLSAHIKAKAQSHLNDRELVQQVFKAEPPTAQQLRLHFPGDPDDKNWQSRQQGLQLLAQGAFAGIRNIAAHSDEEWTEHEALEHLAVLSVVARWADLTEVRVWVA